jgi:hypothetical protein
MTSDGTDTGAKRSVTQGDWIACMVEFVSFVASDSVTLASISLSPGRDTSAYTVMEASAIWNKASFATLQLRFVLKYDDGTYANISPDLLPIATFASTSYADSSTPDEYALRFQTPMDCELSAVMLRATLSQVCDVVLYDSGGSVVFTVSHDPDFTVGAGSHVIVVPPTTLTANTTYRLALKPTSGSTVTLYGATVNSNAHLGAFPGGIEHYQSTRVNGGAWTDSTTTRPWIYLFLSGIELGSVGGGGGGGAFTFIG